MRVQLNPMFDLVSGQCGDNLIIKEVRGGTVAARRPILKKVELTEEQEEHRYRFRRAVMFGKMIMADGSLRPLYEEVAQDRKMPVFAVTIADFFNAPKIKELDASQYRGQIDDPIQVLAADDFGVLGVNVQIRSQANELIEQGEAVKSLTVPDLWIYRATVAVPAGTMITIEAIAKDRPGGMGISNLTKTV